MRTDAAVRIIMQRLLETMRACEAGVLAGADAEFLHNFRIALRRNRSLLGQIRGVMPQRNWQRLSHGFAWLSDITRSARDLDVYLLVLEADKTRLTPAASDALTPLREFFQHRQQLAYQQLVACLNSPRYAKLIAAWAAYLALPLPVHSKLPDAQRPLLVFANQRIWRMLRRVIRQGNAIRADSPPQALHELRKSCKKLRYLMEFFRSLYPAAMMKQPLKVLKALQNQLGECQDLQVQQALLVTFQQSVTIDGSALQRTLAAVERMRCRLVKRETKRRKSFRQCFAAFVEARQRKVFRQLFKP
ncbi:MAG: CHAD domain-containing protein [Sulfuriferula sp.]